jgi:hypothetical protein
MGQLADTLDHSLAFLNTAHNERDRRHVKAAYIQAITEKQNS